LEEVLMKVKKCAEGASIATGAILDFHPSSYSLTNMINNKTLCKFFEKNLIELGMEIDELERHEHLGSSDIGNVSYVVPAIQPLIAVGEKDIAIHSREFGKATISKKGDQSLILATKALAFTFLDLMVDKEIFHKIKMEHKASFQF
ncbi:MAG: amidohydrolase, partial [Candidatus Bathyarchaeia archaeon]